MGTTSMIWLKVRKEDYGKVLTADPTKIPTRMEDLNFDPDPVKLPDNPGGSLDNELYIGVYCNYDGYPSGVGAELAQNYKTYEDVLNLILLGELSCVCEYVVSYKCWKTRNRQYGSQSLIVQSQHRIITTVLMRITSVQMFFQHFIIHTGQLLLVQIVQLRCIQENSFKLQS